jgi:hypothetical protein
MKGINFVKDEKDKKVAVLIDLKEHGEIWEDFYDILIAEKRKNEETFTLEEVKAQFHIEGKL